MSEQAEATVALFWCWCQRERVLTPISEMEANRFASCGRDVCGPPVDVAERGWVAHLYHLDGTFVAEVALPRPGATVIYHPEHPLRTFPWSSGVLAVSGEPYLFTTTYADKAPMRTIYEYVRVSESEMRDLIDSYKPQREAKRQDKAVI